MEWEEGDEKDDAPYVAEVLRTKRLELVDDTGKVLGVFGVLEGSPFLALYDTAGNTRAEFRVVEGEPSLLLFDTEERLRAQIQGQPQYRSKVLDPGYPDETPAPFRGFHLCHVAPQHRPSRRRRSIR